MKKILDSKIIQFVLILLAIVFIFSIVFPNTRVAYTLRNGFSILTEPVGAFFYRTGLATKRTFGTLFNLSQIGEENEELRLRLIKLESENAKLSEVAKENQILRGQLGLNKKESEFKLIASDVVGFGQDGFEEIITLNKGKKDGVKKDNPVISGNFLIGKVVRVYSTSCQVELITSIDSVINGMIQSSRAKGIIKGEIGFGLKMESIPKKLEIKNGQTVVTSGLGGGYPKGLVIGYIDKVLSSEGDIFASADLSSPINFNDLEIVFIIR